MQVRRLQEMGGATLLVSLPKEWIRKTSLKKGSVVAMDEAADGGLIIYPSKEENDAGVEREIDIVYPSRYRSDGIPNEVTAAYLLGYDLIRISGREPISSRDREKIISAMKLLIGLEIVEEDARSITAQFLVDKTVVEPSKIFRRISSIVRAMISDTLRQLLQAESTVFESVAQRDDEVDRLHFLLVRLIRTAVREPLSGAKFGLSPIDCLDYRVAASSLETAGDYAVELSDAVSHLLAVPQAIKDRIEELNNLLDAIQSNSIRSFIQRDFRLAQKVLDDSHKLQGLISSIREEGDSYPAEVFHIADTIERIGRCQRDIADLVSPMGPAYELTERKTNIR
jgi:phosphate uptake regulator